MTDDLGERESRREGANPPAEDGLRSDHACTGTGVAGPAPAGGDPERIAEGPAGNEEPATGAGRTAGGGAGDGQQLAGEDAQTDWLRTSEGR